jgi:hypothetical protein
MRARAGMQKRKRTPKEPMQRRERPDAGNAFLPDPGQGPAQAPDVLAETLAEEFLASATSAEEASEDVRDALVPEELGGPFVETTAREEMDRAPDASNPPDAAKEPFPRAVRLPYK